MMRRGTRSLGWLVVVLVVLAMGAASAWAQPSGIVRPPVSTSTPASTSHHSAAAPGASSIISAGARPGSPSPQCDPVTFSCSPPLLYGGGPVMHAVTTHVIVWAPSSATPFPAGYVSGFETYLSDLQHDRGLPGNITSVASQYVDASGPALSSLNVDPVITDSNPYPTSACSFPGASVCLTEQQITTQISSLIAGLPSDLDQSYIVLLPPEVDSCIDSSSTACEGSEFCGYHDVLPTGSGTTTFALLPYTDSSFGSCYDYSAYPYGTSNALGTLDSIGAHELIESATDPTAGEPGYKAGYLDVNGWEIADECAYDYGSETPASGGGYENQMVNHNPYLIQMMWSNQDNNCEQGDNPPTVATISEPPVTVTGSPASFAVALSGPSVIPTNYQWSFLSPSGVLYHASGATPAVSFSVGGAYTAWVQITDAAGGTVTGVSALTVRQPPTADFGWSPSVPAAGTSVAFTQTALAGTGSITGYNWTFGDCATSTAANPKHVYGSAGNYRVSLTVTQSDGLSTTATHPIQVTPADTPPTAAFSVPTGATAGRAVTFTSSSKAGTGSLSGASWDFGDSQIGSGSSAAHTYDAPGQYTVTLTVIQSDGLTASVQHVITVGSSTAVAASARSSIKRGLVPARAATRITALLMAGGATSVFKSPAQSGRLSITWYATVKHKKVVIARGSGNMTALHLTRIRVKLTAAGRRLLRKSTRLRVTADGVYHFGNSTVTVHRRFTLRR